MTPTPPQTALRTASLEIPAKDGSVDAYLVHPDDDAPHPGVLLYMDAFGLRPALYRMADRIAAAGYTVLVPNVFYRHGHAPVVELPEFIDVKERPDLFKVLGPMIFGLTAEQSRSDAEAFLDWFADSPLVADGPIGTTGYCMGARLALRTAGGFPDRIAAAAGFHGGGLATEEPDSPHLGVDGITAELYFGHADNDSSLPPEAIARLEKALDEAGVRYRSEVYEGATHGYTQADTSSHNPEAAERHWTELLALFARAL